MRNNRFIKTREKVVVEELRKLIFRSK